MHITFLIGNGFDINLGLSTKYTDFIKVYRTVQNKDNETIRKFKEEIINQNLPLWANAEMAFGSQTSMITDGFTVEDYCNCHRDFCMALADYLREEQKRFKISKENSAQIVGKFSRAVNNLTIGFRAVQQAQILSALNYHEGMVFNFIDFNYTNILDKLCYQTANTAGWGQHNSYKNLWGKLIHVHGTVDKDMILGVHDESQIANIECFKSYDIYYLAQLIKSQTDNINEENTYNETLQLLNSSSIIYIYGMSLGETDKLWWKSICQLLTKNSKVQIVLHCHGIQQNELLRVAIKRFEDMQIDKLFELGDVNKEQRNTLRSRVHVTGVNIFKDLSNIVDNGIDQAKAS